MAEPKNNILIGIILLALFGLIALGVWEFTKNPSPNDVTSTFPKGGQEGVKRDVAGDAGQVTTQPIKTDGTYTVTNNNEKGIDVSVESKSPFKMTLPTSLGDAVMIALGDNRTIEVREKDGGEFKSVTERTVTNESSAKLRAIIEKDPTLSTYVSADKKKTVFYSYQKTEGEQKQWLFKNWTLYDTQTNKTESVSYEMRNALVNIDALGNANVFFDDKTAIGKRTPDFTIPRPYILDKDAKKTDLMWVYDATSQTLSVSFSVPASSYPIALDPSVLKTDTVIATFSGKRIYMSFACGTSTVTDVDGNTYNTVLVGSQCWTKENMMTTKYPDGTSITRGPTGATWVGDNAYYAYPPNVGNTAEESLANIQANKLGFVYQWSAAMKSSVTPGAQGICPTNWHVPTHDEYTTLERAVCTSGTCVTDFPIDTSTTGWRGTNEGSKLSLYTSGGNNSSGFGAILAGYRNTDGSFGRRSAYAYLWSSTPSGGNAWNRYLYSSGTTVSRYPDAKASGFSVRCLKN